MASSSDGMNWIISKVDPVRSYRAVGAGSGGFVAVGDQGTAFSVNGVNWTMVDQSAPMAAVVYGQGTWVAAGLSGMLSLSSDGHVWQSSSLPSVHDVDALAFGDGQFTAVGDAGRILVSPNGQTWIDQCLGPDTDLFGLTQGPGLFAAVGEDAILTSSDGTNWARGSSSK